MVNPYLNKPNLIELTKKIMSDVAYEKYRKDCAKYPNIPVMSRTQWDLLDGVTANPPYVKEGMKLFFEGKSVEEVENFIKTKYPLYDEPKQQRTFIGPKFPDIESKNGVASPIGSSFNDLHVTSQWGKDRERIKTNQGLTQEGHNGMDFGAPIGTRINSVFDGVVSSIQKKDTGYGYRTIIKNDNGSSSLYGHQNTIDVNVGDRVKSGEHIGTVGMTGKVTGPHLHFSHDGDRDGEFTNDHTPDNPEPIFYSGEAYEN